MVDIVHRIGVKDSSPDKVFDALTTLDGLSAWWTSDTTGSVELDGVIAFRFGPGGFDLRVVELEPGERVLWEVVDGPEEWVGTTVRWDIRQDGEWTIVLFAHQGWAAPVEFMYHCSTKWATFLMSLKSLLETGTGAPAPRDVHVAFPD